MLLGRNQRSFLAFVILTGVLLPFDARAETIFVHASATGGNTGSSWIDAYTDLQAALSAALPGDEIWVAAGTYKPAVEVGGSGDRYRAFQLKNGVGVYGGFAGTETNRGQRNWHVNKAVLSGDLLGNDNENVSASDPTRQDNCFHVFNHPLGTGLDHTAVLDGFSVTGGNANLIWAAGCGGGMYHSNSDPTICNCTFSHNTAVDEGGGLYNYGGSPVLTNCIFSENAALDKWAGLGGGLFNYGGSPILSNCVFSGNSALGQYGGLGGGVYSGRDSSLAVTNCTFYGNFANGEGGGMYNESSGLEATNCIFWANSASGAGQAIYGVTNVAYCNVQVPCPGMGNISVNPLFLAAANGDFRLTDSSPCIDTGTNAAVQRPATDLVGNPRISHETVDMGALEHTGVPRVSLPTFTPGAGGLELGTDVVVACLTPGAAIRYTTDGREPSLTDPSVGSGEGLSLGIVRPVVLKARAWKQGWQPSDTMVTVYRQPLVIRVSTVGDDEYHGFDWTTAKRTLQAALDSAESGDEIWVAVGTYKPTIEIGGQGDRYRAFQLKDGVGVYGGFAGTESSRDQRDWLTSVTVLSGDLLDNDEAGFRTNDPTRCDNCYHVLYHRGVARLSRTTVLDGFQISGGYADGDRYAGGGMCNVGGSSIVANCTFTSNMAEDGAGMFNEGGNPTISNCVFHSNQAYAGGGVENCISNPTVVNCAFRHNWANERGGGMYNRDNSCPTIADCDFIGNSASYQGGGMYNLRSDLLVSHCTFSANYARSDGGGMYNLSSELAVVQCTFNGNITKTGGGIFISSSDVLVDHCVFSDNAVSSSEAESSFGGGLRSISNSAATVTNCVFAGNSAPRGGGIDHEGTNLTVANCLFSRNQVRAVCPYDYGYGGGICNKGVGGIQRVTNCTFVENSATAADWSCGGGMYNGGQAIPTIANCIFWGNSALASPQINARSSVTVSYSNVQGGYEGMSNIDAEPMFVDMAGDDFRLQAESLCIDAGDNAAVPEGVTTDLEGNPRICGDSVDMGAYECQSP